MKIVFIKIIYIRYFERLLKIKLYTEKSNDSAQARFMGMYDV